MDYKSYRDLEALLREAVSTSRISDDPAVRNIQRALAGYAQEIMGSLESQLDKVMDRIYLTHAVEEDVRTRNMIRGILWSQIVRKAVKRFDHYQSLVSKEKADEPIETRGDA